MFFNNRIFPLRSGADAIYYPVYLREQGIIIRTALEAIDQNLGKNEAIATFPTGAFLNYLTRRDNPIHNIFYDPFVWSNIGESPVINSLKTQRPRYIILIARYFSGFKYPWFGHHFGEKIYGWIKENYVQIRLFGKDPYDRSGFGIQILEDKFRIDS